MPDDSLFHEWRAADRKAHLQEQATTTASLRALEGNGEGPSDEALQKARTLRHTADTLFQRAMHELKLRVARIRGSSPPACACDTIPIGPSYAANCFEAEAGSGLGGRLQQLFNAVRSSLPVGKRFRISRSERGIP